MRIVAFNGSPRINGNIDILLSESLKEIDLSVHEVIRYDLNKMKITPCQDCGGCDKTGKCIIDDDMGKIYDAIRFADRVIVATPIFFFSVSAQTKAMIDRCQALWCERYLLKRDISDRGFGRKGLLLLVGGMKKEIGANCADACVKAFFRTISVPKHETVNCLGVDEKGAILKHPDYIYMARNAVKRLLLNNNAREGS
ncbi:MAG: flavodoxin family protein [Thermodesulfovibrionales bacterium]|nr:flavodoxin family protein [Thermodesulfovibrionales bacterium]